MSFEERKYVRELWTHEDHLINHRISWLGVTQALLFAAFGVVIAKDQPGGIQPILSLFKWIVPIVGFIASILIFIGVKGAIEAMEIIKVQHGMKELGLSDRTTKMGWVCGIGIPLVFIAAWSVVLLAMLANICITSGST